MEEIGQGDRPLYRLAYVSDIVPSSFDRFELTLRQILTQAYVLNTRDDITGFLITYRGWYAQALEGPRAAVEACYARIAADPRHANPQVAIRGPVGRRLFPQWSMCGFSLSARDAGLQELAEQEFNLNLRAVSPDALMHFLDAVSGRYNGQVDRLYRTLKAE